jgi:hypothetical protein
MGFSTHQKLDKFGMRGSDTCELVFDNCDVPKGRSSVVVIEPLFTFLLQRMFLDRSTMELLC